MKKIFKYILCVVLFTTALQSYARDFESGERIYFKASPEGATWWKNGTYENTIELWGQFKNGGSDYWVLAKWYDSDFCYLEVPAGTWYSIRLARCDYGNRYSIQNQTQDMSLDVSAKNYIHNFYDNGTAADWKIFAPYPIGDPSSWSYDDEQICTSAAGTNYVLAPVNYNYEISKNHSWFMYSGGTWTRLDGGSSDLNITEPGWYDSDEGKQDYPVTLGAANSDTYYFLQASKPSGCRLVRVRLNQDCSEGAEGACAITSFVGVASDANVTDETSAIDGLVAFDDKKNAGRLMVWCPGVDTVYVENDDIETPQTFKLEGFPASSITTYTLYAKFLDGVGCESTCNVTVRPPTASVTTHTTTQTSSDLRLTRFTEEDVTLTPTDQSSASYRWTNTANDDKFTEKDGIRNRTFTAPTEQKDISYIFLAANEPEAPEGNLIKNGEFENNEYFTSDYKYWGKDIHNFPDYDNPMLSDDDKSGGYAITDDANDFYHTYNKVVAHSGKYFGLFDSKIYDGNEQAAWTASTADNPQLKVQAGVSYLFSFWVANVNNFGEMNNGAQLQFQISYSGGTPGSWVDLGSTIDLSDYKDNRWHGMSSIATPTVSSDNVKIRVINLNQSNKNRGNDFALDDIRFEAVTSRSTNISAYEIFPVKYLKCVINGATFTQRQPVGCGTAVADVDYTVNFVNPRGDLYIYEGSALLAKIDHDDLTSDTYHIGVLTGRPVDNADHVLTVYFDDTHVKTDAPTTYTYNAKAVPAISVKSLAWNSPACDVTTATLTAVIKYTNQNGTLSANVDGGKAVTNTYEVENDDEKEVTLVIPDVLADGKTGHKLNVTFSGSHGCSIVDYDITKAAPYSPNISAYTATIQPYACGEGTTQYQVKAEATFSNGQGHQIVFEDWNGNKQTVSTLPTDTKAETTFNFDWETPASRAIKVYFVGAEACADNHAAAFTSPAKPEISVAKPSFSAMDCNKKTYTLTAAVTYTNQNGTLNVWLDDDVANKKSFTYNADKHSADVVNVELPNLAGDGAAHKLNVEFDGSHGCRRVVADGNEINFTAPFAPVISAVKVTPQDMKCSETSYSVTVAATLSANAVGKTLTVEGDNGTNTYTIASTTFSQTYTVAQASAAGKFRVYFNDADNCTAQKTTDYTYTVPTIPTLTVNAVSVPTPACDHTTFNLNVTGSYNYQHGSQLEFYWDGELKTTQTISPLSAGAIDVTLSGLVYDGSSHTLLVKTDNDVFDCQATQSSIAVPFMPAIASVKATPTQMTCGVSTYDVEVSFNVTNGQGKNVTVSGKGQTKSFAATEGANSVTFTGIGVDAAADQFEIWFADATDCSTHKVATYTEPVVPQMSVATPLFSAMDCNKTTYTLSAVVTYTNQNGTLTAWVDGGAKQTFAYDANQPTEKTVTITIADLAGDGAAHKLNVEFDGSHGCRRVVADGNEINFTAPFAPVISAVKVTPQDMKCGETAFNVTIEATLSANAVGKSITIAGDNGTGKKYEVTSPSFVQELTITQSLALGEFYIFFDDADNCDANQTLKHQYSKPFAPTLSVNDDFIIPEPKCDQKTFDLDVVVTYSNLHGNQLQFLWDEKLFTEDLLTPSGTLTKRLDNLDYDGGKHTLTVKTDNANDCQFTKDDIKVGATPSIKEISFEEPTQLSCGEQDYLLPFEILADNQKGGLQIADNGTVVYDGAAVSEGVLTILADGLMHNLTFKFKGANDCEKTVQHQALGVPTLSIAKVSENPVGCGDTQYTATFEIKYANQSTQLTLTDKSGNILGSWTPADLNEHTESITLTRNLTESNKDTLIAEFAQTGIGIKPCKEELVFDLPQQHGIKSFIIGQPQYSNVCRTAYEIPFTIDYVGLTGDLIIADANQGNKIIWQGNVADGKMSNLVPTTNIETMSLFAWFADNTACQSENASAQSLPMPTLSVAKSGDRVINFVDKSFTENLTITFQNQGDRTLFIVANGAELTHYDSPVSPITYTYHGQADNKEVVLDIYFEDASCKVPYIVVAQPEPVFNYNDPIIPTPDCYSEFELTLSFTYSNQMPNVELVVEDEDGNLLTRSGNEYKKTYVADGKSHEFTLYFNDNPEASWKYEVQFPQPTSLTFVNAEVSALDVDTMYVPTIYFSQVNLSGALVVKDENGADIVPTEAGADYFVLPAVKADGKTHIGELWFALCPNNKVQYTYISPAVPQLTITPSIGAQTCDGMYEAIFDFQYANQFGNLVIANENGEKLDDFTQSATGTTHYSEKMVADGSDYTIQVWFDGGAKRVATATLKAPVIGVITSVTAEPVITCSSTPTYDLNVHLTVDNPTSDVVIELDGVERATVPFTLTIGSNIERDITITDLPTNAPVSTLRAWFKNRPDCDITIATTVDVIPQPTISISETAGKRICSTDANVDIDYVATGISDLYSLRFSDPQFTDIVNAQLTSNNGTISVPMPTNIQPGKYTATLTIGHHATECTASDVFSFEISAGDMLYSKWNDVLLVANRDGLFTAYQWYHNGERMEGETMQRLYNPADMTGLFYCEVTMDDGTVFTTCDGEFAQGPYSRDQNKVTPTEVPATMPLKIHRAANGEATIGLYTVAGQLVAIYHTDEIDYTIHAPNQSGVYLVIVQQEGYKWTQKIVVK